MRLLKYQDDKEFCLVEFFGNDVPPYAILSHTWGEDHVEVSFKDLTECTGKEKAGYRKLTFCEKQAAKDGLHFFWIDTCCIDKSSSSELTEAINSMFRWYHNAAKCYVYLSDVSVDGSVGNDPSSQQSWNLAFKHSRWFTRGWTLQELLAPRIVEFFSAEGERLGDKQSLEKVLYEITGITISALRGSPLSQFSSDERMSWAEKRKTKREEDGAYSLLGIFDINMPLIYGEGRKRAFGRLRREITESLKDESHPLPPQSFMEQLKRRREPLPTISVDKDPELMDSPDMLAWIREKCCVPALFDQTEREYDCVKALKQISSLPNECGTDESIAWFVRSTKCRLWMTDEFAKILCYLVPYGVDATTIISKFLQRLFSYNSTAHYITSYVDFSKYDGRSTQDTQYYMVRSVIYQILAQIRQLDRVLCGLFMEAMEHDVNDFWRLVNPSKGRCSLDYLTKALAYIVSHPGNNALSLIIINASQKVVNNAHKPLLDLLNSNISSEAQVRTLICTHLKENVPDIVGGNLTYGLEDEIHWCTSSLKFQEWEQRRTQVEPPLEGSDEWIWIHPAFESWTRSGGVLWITGKPGSGKSTIARMITERIPTRPESKANTWAVPETASGRPIVVASFFYSTRLGTTAMGHDYMLRSILYQVLSHNQALYRHFQSTFRKLIQEQYGSSTWKFRDWGKDSRDRDALNLPQEVHLPISWSLEALERVFENIVEDVPADQTKVYCILDGFDESEEGSVSVSWHNEYMSVRKRTLLWLKELSVRKIAVDWLRVIVLSRPTADIKLVQRGSHSIVVEEHNKPDIEKIVEAGLKDISDTMRKWESLDSVQTLWESRPELDSWEHHPGSTSTTLRSIHQRILQRANNVILWVKLVLKELQTQLGKSGAYTLEDVDRAIDSLPEGLEELYKELISRLCVRRSKSELTRARHMLMWACFAKRPMALLEFQDAVATTSWRASSGLSFAEHLNRNRIQLFDQSNLAPIERDIIDSCGCLIEFARTVAWGGQTVSHVQVTHQTVLDFVLRQDRAAEPFNWNYSEAESLISSAIHAYLDHCTETGIHFPERTAASTFYQGAIMPLIGHLHDRPFLHYILQHRQGQGLKPNWLGDRPVHLSLRNVIATVPTAEDISAGHEDIDTFTNALIEKMGQFKERWRTSGINMWTMAEGDLNDLSGSRKISARSGPEIWQYNWEDATSPATETTRNLSPIVPRTLFRQSLIQDPTHSGRSSQQSPHNRKRCFKCHQPGHIKRDCPQRAKNNT